MKGTTRVLIVDDHRMLREGLRAILAGAAHVEVVGEASNGREAKKLAHDVRPDVVVMDVGMPEMNGIEATREILRGFPGIRVVALSTHADKRYVENMLAAGAAGYVLKNAAHEELLKAIQVAMEGGRYLSPEIAHCGPQFAPSERRHGLTGVYANLAMREREVLQLLAEGRTSREIAESMSISVKTVETHRRNIMSKLNLHSVAELTKYAVREGMTSLES
jgi:DNA-binding NarL/FixJ family response regulator